MTKLKKETVQLTEHTLIQSYLNERDKYTAEELGKEYQTRADEFKTNLQEHTNLEELKTLEQTLIEDLNSYDQYVRGLKYDIPKSCEFDGETYKQADVEKLILYFIDKQEVQWNYALGLYGLYKFWKQSNSEVSYGILDSTLRILGQVKCAGFKEWKYMLIINEFTKAMDENYTKDLVLQGYLSQKHNAVLDRMELIKPVTSTN